MVVRNTWLGEPAAAQMGSSARRSRSSSSSGGVRWPTGATPPIAKPVRLTHPVGVCPTKPDLARGSLRRPATIGARGDHHHGPHPAAEHDGLGDLRHVAAHGCRRIGSGTRAGGKLRDGVGMACLKQCGAHTLHRPAGFRGGHPISPRQWNLSRSISTGRSAWPSVPIATSTPMCANALRSPASARPCSGNWNGRPQGLVGDG